MNFNIEYDCVSTSNFGRDIIKALDCAKENNVTLSSASKLLLLAELLIDSDTCTLTKRKIDDFD